MKKHSIKSLVLACVLGMTLAGTTIMADAAEPKDISEQQAQTETTKIVGADETYASEEDYNLTSLEVTAGTYHVQGPIVIKGKLKIAKDAVLSIEKGGSITLSEGVQNNIDSKDDIKDGTKEDEENNNPDGSVNDKETEIPVLSNEGIIQIDTQNGGAFNLDNKVSLEETSPNNVGTIQIVRGIMEEDENSSDGENLQEIYKLYPIIDMYYGEDLQIPDFIVDSNWKFVELSANKTEEDNYICTGTYNPNSEDDLTSEDSKENSEEAVNYHTLKAQVNVHINKVSIEYEGESELTVEEGQTLQEVQKRLQKGFIFVHEDGTVMTEEELTKTLTEGKQTLYINYKDINVRNNYNNFGIALIVKKRKPEQPTQPIEPEQPTQPAKPSEPTQPAVDSASQQMKQLAQRINSLGTPVASRYNANTAEQTFALYNEYQTLSAEKKNKLDNSAKQSLINWYKLVQLHCCGEKGDSVYYAVSGRTLTIFGKGRIANCFKKIDEAKGTKQVKRRAYNKYSSSIQNVIVREGISYIGNGAFAYMGKLKKVEVQGTGTSFGIGAFFKNGKLSKVILKDGGKGRTIAFAAFAKCTALKSIRIPNGISKIEKSAFYKCKKLTYVDFPASLTNLGDTTFMECKNLKKLIVRGKTKKCGKYAFYGVKKSGKKQLFATKSGQKSKIAKIAKKARFKVKKLK